MVVSTTLLARPSIPTPYISDRRARLAMTLRKTIEVVTTLANQGVIDRYAIAGAVAALKKLSRKPPMWSFSPRENLQSRLGF
jgi:hypothetical protein